MSALRQHWSTALLALLLLVSAALVVVGVAAWSVGGAFVASGVLLAGWSFLLLAEVGS